MLAAGASVEGRYRWRSELDGPKPEKPPSLQRRLRAQGLPIQDPTEGKQRIVSIEFASIEPGSDADRMDTPLVEAARCRPEAVPFLLEAGADPYGRGRDRATAQIRVAQTRGGHHSDQAQAPWLAADLAGRALLAKGAARDAVGSDGETALMKAADVGNRGLAEALLDAGARLDRRDPLGNSALCHALEAECAGKGQAPVEERVSTLLRACGAVADTSPNQSEALISATAKMRMKTLSGRLEEGAQPDDRDREGRTAAHMAVLGCRLAPLELLLRYGADPGQTVPDEGTLLMTAVKCRYCDSPATKGELVQLLLDRGAQLEARNDAGRTALLVACENKALDMVRLLLENGADMNASDKHGRSALHLAALKGSPAVVAELLASGATVDAPAWDGHTPLFSAMVMAEQRVVELLLDAGASLGPETQDGMTPLMYAIALGCHRGGLDPDRTGGAHRCAGRRRTAGPARRRRPRAGRPALRPVDPRRGRSRGAGRIRLHASDLGGLRGSRPDHRALAGPRRRCARP